MNRRKMSLSPEAINKRRENMIRINKQKAEKKALEKNKFEVKFEKSDKLAESLENNPTEFKLDETIITHKNPDKTKVVRNRKVKITKSEEPKPAPEIDKRDFISRALNIIEIK